MGNLETSQFCGRFVISTVLNVSSDLFQIQSKSTKRMVPENVAFRSFPTVLEEQEGRSAILLL